MARNNWDNLNWLTPSDEIKFVLCDETDYQWARELISSKQLARLCPVLMSPVHGQLTPVMLAEWILRDQLQVRLQIQMHKLLWGEGPGH